MSKNINFKARSKTEFEVQPKPYPAVKKIPAWYMDMEPYENLGDFTDNKLHVRNNLSNATFKKCIPLLDGLSAGYIIPLWSDVQVEINDGQVGVYWKHKNVDVFEPHGQSSRQITPPVGYHNLVLKYMNCWIPQTPPGYSCLIISPLGYNDLTFKAIPAIVDTDTSTLELIFPMWIKKDFEGIVEKGTPMVQVIPFKRDNWQSTFDYYEDGEYRNIIETKNFKSTIVGHYLKNHWSKKKFK